MNLPLQECQARWAAGDDDWGLYDRAGERIGVIPAVLNESQVMAIVHMMRAFEREAFNQGVQEGLDRGSRASEVNRRMAEAEIASLTKMNEVLSSQLERHITGEEESL